MEKQFKSLESNLSKLLNEIVELKELFDSNFKKIDSNFQFINGQLAFLENDLKELNIKVGNLESIMSKRFYEVGGKIETLTEDIQKNSALTLYFEMYNNKHGLN